MNAEFLIPMSFFAMVFGIVYISIKRKERRMLIERGLDASLLEPKHKDASSLKWGMVFVGVGLGIFIGKLLVAYTSFSEEAAYFSMICLLGGLALVIYHFIEKSQEKKEPPAQL